jgi:hypothetical protein
VSRRSGTVGSRSCSEEISLLAVLAEEREELRSGRRP